MAKQNALNKAKSSSELKEQIQLVANRLKDAGSLSSSKEEAEAPPPHY